MTTGQTIALTIHTFVGKVICLLFDMLSRFVIALLSSSKHLLISPSAVILEPKKIKSVIVCTFSSFIYHQMMGVDDMILVFWILSFKPLFFTLLVHFHQEALEWHWSNFEEISLIQGQRNPSKMVGTGAEHSPFYLCLFSPPIFNYIAQNQHSSLKGRCCITLFL